MAAHTQVFHRGFIDSGVLLGPPGVHFYPFLGEGSPTKIDYRKWVPLILTSLLEALVWVPFTGILGSEQRVVCIEFGNYGVQTKLRSQECDSSWGHGLFAASDSWLGAA